MKLESLKSSKFEALTKPQMSKITGGGEPTGAGAQATGRYVEGKGWELRTWSSDEQGAYTDPDTGETADYFREYGSETYYVKY